MRPDGHLTCQYVKTRDENRLLLYSEHVLLLQIVWTSLDTLDLPVAFNILVFKSQYMDDKLFLCMMMMNFQCAQVLFNGLFFI